MKRANSRNQQNQNTNFTQGQAPYSNTQAFSRQTPNLVDLHKSSTQKREIHLLMEEIDLPNESLTISSLSQSPFMARSTNMLNGTQGDSNENEGTLGRSELEQTYNDTSKSLSITRRNDISDNNQTSHSYIEEDDEDSSSRQNYISEEPEDYDDGKYAPRRNQFTVPNDRQRTKSENARQRGLANITQTTDQEESKLTGGRDSPDFNRHYDQGDDLTVSNTVVSNINASYRGGYSDNLSKLASNRTFADSVLNHNQINSSSSNTNRRPNQRQTGYRGQFKQMNEETSDNIQGEDSDDIQERESEDEQDRSKLSSDISGVDSFAQTYYSKRSHTQAPRSHFPKVQAPSVDLEEGMSISMKRSPLPNRFQNMEHDESLNMTPSSLDGKWLFQQKSMIGGKNNRTTDSDFNQIAKLQPGMQSKLQNNSGGKGQNSSRGGAYNITTIINSNRHNRSRDPELEQALEEESQQHITLQRTTLSDSKESSEIQGSSTSTLKEVQKLRFEVATLKTQNGTNQAEVQRLANEFEQKELDYQQSRQVNLELEHRVQDLEEHLHLLKNKYKDESKLPFLRGKALDSAKSELKQMRRLIEDKENRIYQIEQSLQQKDCEDRSSFQLMQEQVKQLIAENSKLKIVLESTKKQILSNQGDFKEEKKGIERAHLNVLRQNENQIVGLNQLIQELKDSIQQYEGQIKKMSKDQGKIEDYIKERERVIKEKDRMLRDKDSEVAQAQSYAERMENETKGFKQRCRELEGELEMGKGNSGLENQSIFGNSALNQTALAAQSVINQTSNNHRKYDFEIKKIKEACEQKIAKSKVKELKWKTLCEEKDARIQRIEEEESRRKKSLYQASEKFEKDQDLINELKQAKENVKALQEFEHSVKQSLSLEDEPCHSKDVAQRIYIMTQEQEEFSILKSEYQKLQEQLERAQKKEIQLIDQYCNAANQQKQSSLNDSVSKEGLSSFTRNLLLSKDKEIERLRTSFDQEKSLKNKIEESRWQIESALNDFKIQNQDLLVQIEKLSEECQRVKESRDATERNNDELKEKLRTLLREQQVYSTASSKQPSKPALSTFLDEVERKKYEDMISLVLSLDLAQDPLQSANVSLQESYLDEFEQACKHLEEQKRLVADALRHLSTSARTFEDQISQLQVDVKDKTQVQESLRKDISRLNGEIKEKDRLIEVRAIEMSELTNGYERLRKQLSDAEKGNERIRQENEQAKADIKKLMRTQEHLFKDMKKPASLSTSTVVEPLQSKEFSGVSMEEHERMQLLFEEQVSQLQSEIRALKKPNSAQTFSEDEFLRILDQLIENTAKVPLCSLLAAQVQKRIDRIRAEYQSKPETQSFAKPTTENPLVKSLKLEIEQHLEDEGQLIESVGKWLKHSGNNLSRGFIQDENNGSLFFSDLVTNQVNNHAIVQEYEQTIGQLKEQLASANQQLEEAQQDFKNSSQSFANDQAVVEELQQQVKSLKEELKQKDQLLKEREEAFRVRSRSMEQDLAAQGQNLWKDVEDLKQQIKQELDQKATLLEREYEEFESAKLKQKDAWSKQQTELESRLKAKQDDLEREYSLRVQNLEKEIKQTSEKSTEEKLTSLCSQLEDQHQSKIKQLTSEHFSTIASLKQDQIKALEDLKKKKEREIKSAKDELESQRKSFEDKAKKFESEFKIERDSMERDHKEKLEQVRSKLKAESKEACDKVRSQLKNQVDSVKNEMAKQKAAFESEKKKLSTEHKNSFLSQEREISEKNSTEKKNLREKFEIELKAALEKQEADFKQAKERMEVQWRKKLDDCEKELNRKLEEGEGDLTKVKEAHKDELRKEKERIEMRMKEQIRAEVKIQVQGELEEEFSNQLQKVVAQQALEIDKLKSKYEVIIREERASQMPIHNPANLSRTVEVQCNPMEEPASFIGQQDSQRHNMSIYSSDSYVEQLKVNFEEELDRQQMVFGAQLTAKQNTSVRIFEEIITLEFDKILQSIFFKSKQGGGSVESLEAKRKQVNMLISDILSRNDDRKEKQMKQSLEVIKKKISEVLKVFKAELQAGFDRRMSQVIEQQELKERVQNMSDIVSNKSHNLMSSPNSSIHEDNSSDYSGNSRLPTPRVLDVRLGDVTMPSPVRANCGKPPSQTRAYIQKQLSATFNKQEDLSNYIVATNFNPSPRAHQLSDVKKYTEELEEGEQDNILKKIAPVPNSKGVLVVEVDKVVRDLQMLMQTIRQAKFFRFLSNEADVIKVESCNSQQEYRSLLNDFFRMIVRLNQGADQLTTSNEVLKQKLLNGQLKEQIQLLSQQITSQNHNAQVDAILNFYGGKAQMPTEIQKCLSALENTQFRISKLQFKMYQVVDLFTQTNEVTGRVEVNRQTLEVAQKCREYANNFSHQLEEQTNQDLLLQSQCSPDKLNLVKISPEMLSPEETAQLIGAVFSRINKSSQPSSNQFDTCQQSFFQTFLSNDDYIRSAENFIVKYREQLNHTQKNSNLPLQMNQTDYFSSNSIPTHKSYQARQNMNYTSVQSSFPLNKKRSRSQQNTNVFSTKSTSLPSQHQVSNVFQSNMLERQNSIYSNLQHILVSNYDTQSLSQGGHEQWGIANEIRKVLKERTDLNIEDQMRANFQVTGSQNYHQCSEERQIKYSLNIFLNC